LTGVAALVVGTAARADDYVSTATKAANAATARASVWDGPKTGPKAAANKKIVFVAGDLKNSGILGASEGVKEAAKAIGWDHEIGSLEIGKSADFCCVGIDSDASHIPGVMHPVLSRHRQILAKVY